MNKQISFEFKGKEYTLEFTRDTVRQLERQGFVPGDIESKPMTVIPDLFAGAFLKNHPTVKRSKIDEIYEAMNGKSRLIRALIEMYNDTVETLIDEDAEGNAEWTANWEVEE